MVQNTTKFSNNILVSLEVTISWLLVNNNTALLSLSILFNSSEYSNAYRLFGSLSIKL